MFKTSRILSILVAAALLLPFGVPDAIAASYVSISEIREKSQPGWYQTFNYNGEVIDIRLSIDIPDIDSLPVISIKWPENLTPSHAPAKSQIDQSDNAGFSYGIESKKNAMFGTQSSGRDRYIEKGAYAEASPFSADEALTFAIGILNPYLKELGDLQLEIDYMDAWSRGYKLLKSTSEGDLVDYNKPTTDMGMYQIFFNQAFYGLPFIEPGLVFNEAIKSEIDISKEHPSVGKIYALVSSADDYYISFHPAIEDGVLTSDLPLAPLERIQNEIIKLIESGYIRDIFRLRLVYVKLFSPSEPEKHWILFPVWEVYGEIMQRPNDPTPSYAPEAMEKIRKFGGTSIFINAQTGIHYNPKDTSQKRSFATFITWDEVK